MSNQLDHVQRSLRLKNNGKLMVALIGCIFLVRFVLIRKTTVSSFVLFVLYLITLSFAFLGSRLISFAGVQFSDACVNVLRSKCILLICSKCETFEDVTNCIQRRLNHRCTNGAALIINSVCNVSNVSNVQRSW